MSDETEFLYLYLHMLDMLGHRHGIREKTFSEVLIEMDNLIDNIISQIIEFVLHMHFIFNV